MTDAAAIVRSHFPRWRSDPYQKAAVDAILRILFAGENTETALTDVETCIAFFLDDPPLSLTFDSPARHAETLADRLIALASELRKGAKQLRGLAAYTEQFNSHSGREGSDELRGSDSGQRQPDECPF